MKSKSMVVVRSTTGDTAAKEKPSRLPAGTDIIPFTAPGLGLQIKEIRIIGEIVVKQISDYSSPGSKNKVEQYALSCRKMSKSFYANLSLV